MTSAPKAAIFLVTAQSLCHAEKQAEGVTQTDIGKIPAESAIFRPEIAMICARPEVRSASVVSSEIARLSSVTSEAAKAPVSPGRSVLILSLDAAAQPASQISALSRTDPPLISAGRRH